MRINIELLLEFIENDLTDANTGSYEIDDENCEDFFDDAENIYEVKKDVEKHCIEFNKSELNLEELYNRILSVEVIWDTAPQNDFYSFKERFETLKEALYGWEIEDLRKYLI